MSAELCMVCLEPLEARGRQTLQCGHQLHELCVLQMRRHGALGACPVCRVSDPSLTSVEQLYESAMEHFVRGSFAQAADALRELCDLDPEHGKAALCLGMLCLDGRGCPQSAEQAFDLLSVAHERGEGAATYALAMLHLKGRGTPADPQACRHLLEQVHQQGCAEATYALAMLHSEGVGTPQDCGLASQLLAEAARLGHGPALKQLAAQPLRVGASVDVQGLPALKGTGQVLAKQEAGRWQVRLDAGGVKSVHERNLAVVALPELPDIPEEQSPSASPLTPALLPGAGFAMQLNFDDLAAGCVDPAAADQLLRNADVSKAVLRSNMRPQVHVLEYSRTPGCFQQTLVNLPEVQNCVQPTRLPCGALIFVQSHYDEVVASVPLGLKPRHVIAEAQYVEAITQAVQGMEYAAKMREKTRRPVLVAPAPVLVKNTFLHIREQSSLLGSDAGPKAPAASAPSRIGA